MKKITSTWHDPVQAATNGPLMKALKQAGGDWHRMVIDGVPIAPGDRVLVKDEPTGVPFQNGIYQVEPNGDWVFVDEAVNGSSLLVQNGTVNVDSIFVLINDCWALVTGVGDPEFPQLFEEPGLGLGLGWDDDPFDMGRLTAPH